MAKSSFDPLSRVHQCYRRQTDRQQTDGIAMPKAEHNVLFT